MLGEVQRVLRHSGKGTPGQGICCLSSTCVAVCTGLRAGNQKTLFGFQLFYAVELFWTSGSSSVKWRKKSYKIGLRINSIDLELPKVINVSEYMRPKKMT